jgi:glycosyltransferase 2 family protein
MDQRTWNRSLLAASLIAATISGISVWLEWNNSEQSTLRLSLLALALVVSAAGVSYSLRIIRFYLLLSQSGVPISLPSAAMAQAVGFALSVTPGSVGEVFKLHLVQSRSGTSMLQSAPALLLDRAMEGAGFLVLVLLSAAAMPSLRARVPEPPLLAISLGLPLGLILLWRHLGQIAVFGQALLNKFSVGRRLLPSLEKMLLGVGSSISLRKVTAGLALTCLARLTDGLVLLLAAQMLGVTLALPIAVFVIALSGFAGGVSLLPAGAGAAEATMASLLMFAGAPLASALAITLLARTSTLWLWVGLGLGMAFILQISGPKHTLSYG